GLEARSACQLHHRMTAIPGPIGADLGQGGAEDRLTPAECAGGDRLVAQAGVRSMAESLEVVAEVSFLAMASGRERTHPLPTGVGVERRHLHAEDPRGRAGVHEPLMWIVESRWIHMKHKL